MSAPVQARRAASAAALVAALLALVALSGQACGGQAGRGPVSPAGFTARVLSQHEDPVEALLALEAATAPDGAAPPAFEREIGLPAGCRDIRSAQDGSVVGYTVDCDSARALREVGSLMAQRGWTEVPLGQAQGASFLKRDGELGWAVVTCTQVGASTSVVVRSAPR